MVFECREGWREWEEGGGRKRGSMAQNVSNNRILILVFCRRTDWQNVAFHVSLLVHVDVQREDQNEDHTNRDAEDGDYHYL